MMPVYQAALLLPALALLLFLTGRVRLHVAFALLAVAIAYGIGADMAMNYIGHSMATGFAQTLETTGLVVVGASVASTFVERTGTAFRLRPAAMLPVGYVAGLSGSAASALALLSVLPRSLASRPRAAAAAVLGLSLLATHGMLLPAPVPVMGMAVLGADAAQVFWIGALVAAIGAIASLVWVSVIGGRLDLPAMPPIQVDRPLPRGRAALLLILPLLLPVGLLILQSLAQIPSEPLGRGATRETLIGFSRPLFLLTLVTALVLLLAWRGRAAVLSADGWLGQAVGRAAGLVLLLGLAGGFAKVLQNTGMAELLAERLLDAPVGILLPFLVAALVKTLQGSTLVAALTAAGMVQPLLPALGLADGAGPALAVVALGAGAVTVSHANDLAFWLVADAGGMTPRQAFALHAGGSIVQGLAAAITLVIAAAMLI